MKKLNRIAEKKRDIVLEICLKVFRGRSINSLAASLSRFISDDLRDGHYMKRHLSTVKSDSFPKLLSRALKGSVSADNLEFLNKLFDLYIDCYSKELGVSTPTLSDVTTERPVDQTLIDELDIASHGTFIDVGFVDNSLWSDKREYVFLEDVYVERSFEPEIDKNIKDPEVTITLLSGEAGCGKSSLLWNLYRHYSADEKYHSILLKSSYLLERNFTKVLSALSTTARKPLLFVDTLDLLLYDIATRQVIFEFILALKKYDCICVATSRPQELATLMPMLKQGILYKIVKVTEYNEQTELQNAIEIYAGVYSVADKDPRKILDNALNIISNDRSLKKLCLNPLTLRMLFSLYAPLRFTGEINVFKLYSEFWNQRVEYDNRPGNIDHDSSKMDLSRTAEKIALIMLAAGKISIELGKNDILLQQLKVDRSKVDFLISRGILKRNKSDGLIEFFHQTFFEHAAARALILKFDENIFNLFGEKVFLKNPEINFFIYPIYEQILVLSEKSKFSERCFALTIQLFQSKNLGKIRAAMYAYCFFEKDHEDVYRAFSNLLGSFSRDEYVLVKRFLFNAANMPFSRLPYSFKLLQIIWDRDIWREQYHVIDLLEYYSIKSPADVLAFLNTNDVISAVLKIQNGPKKKELNPALGMLISGITNLHSYDPKYVSSFCKKLISYDEDKIHILLFRTLLNSPFAKFDDQATEQLFDECYSLHEQTFFRNASYAEAMSVIISTIFLNKWTILRSNITAVLQDIANEKRPVAVTAKLSALGRYCSNVPTKEQFAILEYFKEKIKKEDLYKNGQALLTGIFSSNQNGLITSFLAHFKEIVARLCKLEVAMREKDNGAIFMECYLAAIDQAFIYDQQVFEDALKTTVTNKLTLSKLPMLSKLVLTLYKIGCDSPKKILSISNNDFFTNYPKFALQLCFGINNSPGQYYNLQEFALQLCILHRSKPVNLCALLDRIANNLGLFINERDVPTYLKNYEDDLLSIVHETAADVSNKPNRINSAHLLLGVLRLNIIETITIETIEKLYKGERGIEALSWIVELYPHCYYDQQSVFEQLLQLCREKFTHNTPNIQSKSEISFLLLVYNANFDCTYLLEEIIAVFFNRAKDDSGAKIKIISRIITKHIDVNKEFSFRLFYRLITSEFLKQQKESKQNEIMHELRYSCSSICRQLELEQSLQLAELLKTIDCQYGKMIINGLTFDPDRMNSYFYKLLEVESVDSTKPCIKDALTNVLQFKSVISFKWPELLSS